MNKSILILSKDHAGIVKKTSEYIRHLGFEPILVSNILNDANAHYCSKSIHFDWEKEDVLTLEKKLYNESIIPEASVTLLESLAAWNKIISQTICKITNHSIDAREILSNKILFRNISFDLNYYGGTLDEISTRKIDFFPCVLKPAANSGGSRHVYTCNNSADLLRNINHLKNTLDNKHEVFIIEELINGPEYSVDGYIQAGKFHPFLFIQKLDYDYQNNQDGLHMISPAIDLKMKHKVSIHHLIQNIVNMLKIEKMWLHVEFRVDKDEVKIIEINPRFGGRLISSAIKHAYQIDPLEIFLKSELNYPVNLINNETVKPVDNKHFLFVSFKNNHGKLLTHTRIEEILSIKNVIDGYIISQYQCANYPLENFFAEFLVHAPLHELDEIEKKIRYAFQYEFK